MQLTLRSAVSLTAILLLNIHGWAGETVLSRIGFGACAKQDQPQPIWEAVVETQPQLLNIYKD